MNRLLRALLLAAPLSLAATAAWAGSIAVDVPLQFTFADRVINTQKSAKVNDQTSTDVSGYLVTTTWSWFGLGYEQYQVSGKGTDNSQMGPLPFKYRITYQFYDALLDWHLNLFHASLGYGMGRVNPALSDAPQPIVLPRVEGVAASQYFVRLGVHLGKPFDVHVGYHVITAQDAKLVQPGAAQPDKLKTSGQTLTAGLRVNW